MKTILFLSDIICSKIKNDRVTRGSCDNSQYSRIISRNLVVTASDRIFSNKYQCILEPVVNSIDAYNLLNNEKSSQNVGKFGLGFFSLFTILLDNPKNSMILSSYHESGSWEADIRQHCISCPGEENYDFLIEFSKIENEKNDTGLNIEILLEDEPEIKSYIRELVKLKYITSASIFLRLNGLEKYINKGNTDNIINIFIDNDSISIDDFAIGISEDTFYNTLLIPSISSKGIKNNIDYIPKIGKITSIENTKKYSNLYILVGDIIVYTDRFINIDEFIINEDDLDYSDQNEDEEKYIFIIQLNSNTPIPSSRDDILIDDPLVQEELLLNIKYLFNLCMEPNHKYVTLKRVIRKYAEKHPFLSSHIENIINETLINYLKNEYYIVPSVYIYLYKNITYKCIPDQDTLHPLIEEHLLLNFKFEKNIINNKNIFIIVDKELPVAEYAYSSSLLFLRSDFIQKENWRNEILILFPQLSLDIDVNVPYFIAEGVKNSFINNYKKLLGMSTWYYMGSLTTGYLDLLQELFNNLPYNEIFYNKLFYLYDRIFDQLRPRTYTYGGGKRNINSSILIGDVDYQLTDKNIKNYGSKISDIFLDILKDHVDFILKEGEETIPTYVLCYTYFSLPDYVYGSIKNKYELVFLSVIYSSMEIENNNESLHFLINLWHRTFGVKSNYDILIKYINSRLTYEDVINVNLIDPVKKSYDIFKQNMNNKNNIINETSIRIDNNNALFSLKDLFKHIYTSDKFDMYDINSYKSINKGNTINSDNLQILDILINDTAVNYIHNIVSVMTKNTSSYLLTNISRDMDNINISIYNYKISEKNILSMFLPYCTLDNRYFLIYKHAKSVKYSTVYNNYIFKWEDVPIIKNNRVVDIMRKLNIEKYNNNKNIRYGEQSVDYKTHFEITFKSEGDKNIEDYVKLLSYIKDEVNVLKHIKLNGENLMAIRKQSMVLDTEYGAGYIIPFTCKSIVTLENELLNDLDTFKLLIQDNKYNDINTKDESDEQYVNRYVNNYDNEYNNNILQIKPYYPTGIYFNFSKGVIKRMQGNKYMLDKYSINIIQNVLDELGLYSLMFKQLKNPYLDIVQNYTSRASYKQALPLKNGFSGINLTNFVLYYNSIIAPYPLCLAEVINIIAEDELVVENTHYLTLQVANKWMSYKKKKEDEEEEEDKDIDTKNITDRRSKISGKTKLFINAFVETFWEIGKSLPIYNKYFINDVPKVKIELLNKEIKGSYDSVENIIKLNTKNTPSYDLHFNLDDIMKYIIGPANDLFYKSYPSSLVIHELAHAWRNVSEGYHEGLLMYDNIIKRERYFNFDEAANYMYDRVIENGLYEKLYNKLNNINA